MDPGRYDQFSMTDPETHFHGHKVSSKGRRVTRLFLLYGMLIVMLLILLLLTGLRFTQLSRDVSDLKFLLVSLNSSMVIAGAQVPQTEHFKGDSLPTFHGNDIPKKGSCEDPWLSFKSSCYLVSSRKLNWQKAEDECERLGAHLMVVNDEEEQNFISRRGLLEHYWIGLVERDVEGTWSWVDGTDFNETQHFWADDQPDNWHVRIDGEDCGQLQFGNFWNDADCSIRSPYVCEKAAH